MPPQFNSFCLVLHLVDKLLWTEWSLNFLEQKNAHYFYFDDRLYRQEKINNDNKKVYYICRSCQVGRICSDEEGQVSETTS